MTAVRPSLAASARGLRRRARRGYVRQHQFGDPQLAIACTGEVDTDHIGRVADGQGRVQDPVFRVRRHDDQAGLALMASARRRSRPQRSGWPARPAGPGSLISATSAGTGADASSDPGRPRGCYEVVVESASALTAEQPGVA